MAALAAASPAALVAAAAAAWAAWFTATLAAWAAAFRPVASEATSNSVDTISLL